MNVRAPLLVAICLSALSAARADEARTFQASIDVLTAPQRDKMNGRSWHEACPVPLDDLVSIHLNYVGFDERCMTGCSSCTVDWPKRSLRFSAKFSQLDSRSNASSRMKIFQSGNTARATIP
jgi:hypothetical protein